MEMLEETVQKLSGERSELAVEPELRLPVPALLPESYVGDPNHRLVLYKQLSSARDNAEVLAIRDDLLDRFGAIPVEGANLIDVIRLKIRCRQAGIETMDVSEGELVLKVGESPRIDPAVLARLLQQPDAQVRVSPDHRIYLKLRRNEDALAEGFGLLDLLAPEATETAIQSPPPPERAIR